MKQPSWVIRARLHARKASHKAAVEDAHRIVDWALREFGTECVVSCSGGKDSVAMAHVVAGHCRFPVVWNDSGLELPESGDVVKRLCEALGSELWVAKGDALNVKLRKGNEAAERTASSTNEICIVRPVRELLKAKGVALNFVGLRMAESRTRTMVVGRLGDGYLSKRWGCAVAWPLRKWSGLDSIAYIVEHGLPLHPAYLRGDFPEDIRVSWIWDSTRERWGEFDYVRRYYPREYHLFRELGVAR